MTTAFPSGWCVHRERSADVLDWLRGEVAELEDHVRAKLTSRLRGFEIDVGVNGLVLRGQAPSYYVKSLAQHAVMQKSRIPIANNRIDVPCQTR